MKRKFIIFIMTISVAVNVMACGRKEEKADNSKIEITKQSDEQVSSWSENDEESQSKEETEQQTTINLNETADSQPKNLYQEFLDGNVLLYFHNYVHKDFYEEMPYFDSNKGYNLSQIMQVLKKEYHLSQQPILEYSYLDCANDGELEVAVRFTNMNLDDEADGSTLVYIIKNISGQLELCYAYETWSRKRASINQYGYYTSVGSGGASTTGYDSGYIDGSGKWNFIQSTEEEGNLESLSFDDSGLKKIPEIAKSKNYDGWIVFYTMSLDECFSSVKDYNKAEKYYYFLVEGLDYVLPDLYQTSVYQDIFNEAGVLTYTPEEIEEMINKKEKQLGITRMIKNGTELNWIQLSVASIVEEEVTESTINYYHSWLINDYDIYTKVAGASDAHSVLRYMPWKLNVGSFDANGNYIAELKFGDYGITYSVFINTSNMDVSCLDISSQNYHIDSKVKEKFSADMIQKLFRKNSEKYLITYDKNGLLIYVSEDGVRFNYFDYTTLEVYFPDNIDLYPNYFIYYHGVEACKGFDISSEYFETYKPGYYLGDVLPDMKEELFLGFIKKEGMGTRQPYELLERFLKDKFPDVSGVSLDLVYTGKDEFGNICYIFGKPYIVLKVMPYVCYEVYIAPDDWENLYK